MSMNKLQKHGTEGQVNRMGDELISRKEALDIIENIISEVGVGLTEVLLQEASIRIKQLDIAFDKEKVIEKIKGIMDDESIRFVDQAVNRTIEIVEKGGVE
mgnify:CR=1 FL=1